MSDVTVHEGRAVGRPRKSNETGDIVAMIAQAARDPSVDVGKMERLHQILRDVKADAAKQAFNRAMNKLQKSLPHITRNVKGDKGWYADLEAIDLATRDMILGAGFSENYGTANSMIADHYRVTCRVGHIDGHVEDFFVDCPVSIKGARGNDVMTPIHGFGSNMTYGRRYLKALIFNIVLRGDDNDGKSRMRQDGVSYINTNQIAELRQEMQERGIEEHKFCAFAGYPLDMMPAKDLEAAIKQIRRKAKMQQVEGN